MAKHSTGVSIKVKVLVSEQARSRRRRRGNGLLTITTLTGAIGLVAAGMWLAVRLIVNPGSIGWLSWIIPGWDRLPLSGQAAQTLAEIQVEAAGWTIGSPIYLSTYPGLSRQDAGFNEFLLPIFESRSHCQERAASFSSACVQMVELRVYRPQTGAMRLPGQEQAFELIDRMAVTGPEELAAIAPLTNSAVASQGSTRQLPMTRVTFMDGKAPLSGIWFHLSGEWKRGSSRVVYGQVIRYDPVRSRLHLVLPWTSPAEQLPEWRQVTGAETAELVVNQAIGLEPQFQVYQVRALNSPAKPVQVEAIALTEAALGDRTYEHGLLLARNGLWTPALRVLQEIKQAGYVEWTTPAQAQMDLVALHAEVTKAQTKRDWASPRQQIVALLIDGQWSEALKLLRSARTDGYDIPGLLSAHSDRLWRRVETALRVNPQPTDVMNWGILIQAVRRDRNAAIAWLRQQHQSARPILQTSQPSIDSIAINRQAQQILALLDPIAEPSPAPSVVTTVAPSPHPTAPVTPVHSVRRIIGSATPVTTFDARAWLSLDAADPLTQEFSQDSNQVWYQVEVLQFQDNQQWRQAPFTDLATGSATGEPLSQTLWNRLGLTHDRALQLIRSGTQPQIIQTTVRGVQIRDGNLYLLVAGEKLAEIDAIDSSTPLLAMTLTTLPWLQPISTLTLTDLSQQHPIWTETIVPALWLEFQQTGQPLLTSTANPAELLQRFGNWSIQLMDLTGDNQPEAILALQPRSPAVSEVTSTPSMQAPIVNQSRTLIFSSQGTVIYSDLQNQERSLVAIVGIENEIPALIIGDAQGYRVQQWSTQNQQFE